MPLVDDRTQQLINVLADCVAQCEACAKDCASQGNADLANCIALCSDCAALCQACIPLIARDSQFSAALCALAAVGDRFGVTVNTIGRRLVERRVDIRLGVGGPARPVDTFTVVKKVDPRTPAGTRPNST